MKKEFLIVTAPVANLREEPVEASSGYTHDNLQKTQLLCNEILLCNEKHGDWYHVEATEQRRATPEGNWHGYPGWVKKASVMFLDALPAFNAVVKIHQTAITASPDDRAATMFFVPMGTRLTIEDSGNADYYKTNFSDGREGWVRKKSVNRTCTVIDAQQLRQDIVETARLFLNTPYLWGGRSPSIPGGALSVVTGVDCSGLTNLAYRAHNLDIPRDACDQWSASTHIRCNALDAADLIFVSAERAHDNIIHVMLYTGGEEFIEASDTEKGVAVNTFEKKFGRRLQDIATEGFIVDKKKIVFASILKTPDSI